MVKEVRTSDTVPWPIRLKTNRKPVDLRGATVSIILTPQGNNEAPVVDAVLEILQGLDVNGKVTNKGKVLYRPQPGDLIDAGVRKAVVRAVWGDGTQEVFPTGDDLHIKVIQSPP